MQKAMKKLSENDQPFRTYETKPIEFALAMVLSLLSWLLLGPFFARILQSLGIPYLTANAPFVAMAMGFLLAKQLLLKQPLLALVTDHPRFRTALFVRAFLLYFVSATLFLVVDLVLHPHYYQPLTHSGGTFLLLFPLVLMFTPLQTSIEELVFRMLPVRVINKNQLRQPMLRQLGTCLISSVLFAAPHLGNREVAIASSRTVVILYYALFGFVVTSLCMKHQGFEIALAVHAANNLFVALVCNSPASSLPSLPLLQTTRPIGTMYDLLQLCTSLALVALLGRKRKES